MIINAHFSKFSDVEEANPIRISRRTPVISYACKKEQYDEIENERLFEGYNEASDEPIDVFYDRQQFFNFEECVCLHKNDGDDSEKIHIPWNWFDSEGKMNKIKMRAILFSINQDSNLSDDTNLSDENVEANVRTSENQKNAFNVICTKVIEDILVHHGKPFFGTDTFSGLRKHYKKLAVLLKRHNDDPKSLSKIEKTQMLNLSKIWNYLLTEMWKTGIGKDYEGLIEKHVMDFLSLEYATYPDNNKTHLCCRKLVNRRKNVVRKKILDTGKRQGVKYKRQGKFSLFHSY